MSQTQFLTEFVARDITDGMQTNMLMLEEPFRVYSWVLDAIIEVPKGFVFQESIPTAAQGIAPLFGASKRAGCVHDMLYQYGGYYDAMSKFHPVSRSTADAVYKEICEAKGLTGWRANVRWMALRLFGWVAWNKARKNDKPPPEEPETVIIEKP